MEFFSSSISNQEEKWFSSTRKRLVSEYCLVFLRRFIFVFSDAFYGAIVDEGPIKHHQIFSLRAINFDQLCYTNIVWNHASDSRVFANSDLNDSSQCFVKVSFLRWKKNKNISCCFRIFVLFSHVNFLDNNNHGHFGNWKTSDDYESFTELVVIKNIKDVSCSNPTLLHKDWKGLRMLKQLKLSVV